jgi:hypothetical protein
MLKELPMSEEKKKQAGRSLETILQRAQENNCRFGIEVVHAMMEQGRGEAFTAKYIDTSDTTLRRMLLGQNTNANPQDSMKRLFKLSELLGISRERLISLFFFNPTEERLAHIMDLQDIYEMLTSEDRLLWESMLYAVLKGRGYTMPHKKGATLHEDGTQDTTRRTD